MQAVYLGNAPPTNPCFVLKSAHIYLLKSKYPL